MEFVLRPLEVEVKGRPHVYQVLEHPGSVAILAVREGRLALIRQMRPAAGEWLWEVPAGTRRTGEAPLETAARELEEETGLRAGRLQELAQFYPAPGYSAERMHLILATDLTSGQAAPEEGEWIEPARWFSRPELTAMARRGELRDAKTLAALWWFTGVLAETKEPPGRA